MSFLQHQHHLSRLPGGDRFDTLLSDFMRPGVITLSEDASVRQAQLSMVSHGVHAVLVVGARSGHPLGWVTARHLMTVIDGDAALTPVRDAITQQAVALPPGATAREAVALLSQSGASHILVGKLEGGAPEGVVSELDLLSLACR